MSNLGPQQQNASYDGVLQVPGGVTAQLQQVQDGEGRATGLWLSSAGTNATTADSFTASINGTAIPSVIPRLISDGLGDYVSVKDFGATGDGVTDDTIALQLAINTAKSQNIGLIFFPSGTYKISDSLTVGGSFGLKGIELFGENATITQTADAPALIIDGTNPSPAPEYRVRAKITGFLFSGPGVDHTLSVGVQCQNGANIEVRDSEIQNFYVGLKGVGCLISRFSNLAISYNYVGISFAATVTFAPNDIHFYGCYIWANTKAIYFSSFPNGAITFIACEIEGNNLSGTTTDGVKVVDFESAGKVTFIGCHFEENPGQYNIFYQGGNTSASLNLIGCECIPGDSCGNVLYMDVSVTPKPYLFVEGSRVTNNVGTSQIVLGTGAKATIIGETSGNVSGDVTGVVYIKNGQVSSGVQLPTYAGVTSVGSSGISYDSYGMVRFVDNTGSNRLGYVVANSTAASLLSDAGYAQIGTSGGTRVVVSRSGTATVEPNGDNTYSLGTASYRWATTYSSNYYLLDAATGTMKQVVLGAADSGGTGYKLLRVAN